MAGLCAPLSTLRRCPRGHLRMTRGRCGSLLLHRDGLAPSTPCRSPGALRSTPVNGLSQDRRACLKGARNGHRRCLRDYAPGSRNSGSMSGKIPNNLTISRIDPTKYWFFDFDCYPTNTDGFARRVSDELE